MGRRSTYALGGPALGPTVAARVRSRRPRPPKSPRRRQLAMLLGPLTAGKGAAIVGGHSS